MTNSSRSSKGSDYARKELVAELASAYLCTSLGIIPTVRHADYTQRGRVATVASANRAAWNAEVEEPDEPNPDAPTRAQALPVEAGDETAEAMDDAEEQRLVA